MDRNEDQEFVTDSSELIGGYAQVCGGSTGALNAPPSRNIQYDHLKRKKLTSQLKTVKVLGGLSFLFKPPRPWLRLH
jgi:hypothetical protein